MHCVKKINDDLYWVGGTDRRLALFENVYPIPRGVSYNAYMMMDEKTVLLDTVDQSVSGQFFENVESVSYTHLDVYKRQRYRSPEGGKVLLERR